MLGVNNLAMYGGTTPREPVLRRKVLLWFCALTFLLSASALHGIPRDEPTVDELKARITSASVPDKAKLCVQVAERQLTETDKFYASEDFEKGRTALGDVVTYSEMARDYSIQSHKHEKQIEIAVRAMTRKLTDMVHSLSRTEQGPVNDALEHLERVRTDLLTAMFPKGAK